MNRSILKVKKSEFTPAVLHPRRLYGMGWDRTGSDWVCFGDSKQMKLEAAAAVLGVAVDADPETLKAAYRRLALRWHPDKCKDADAKERFQEVSGLRSALHEARFIVDTRIMRCDVIRWGGKEWDVTVMRRDWGIIWVFVSIGCSKRVL